MTDQTPQPLQLLGSAGVVCEGDFCEVPAQHGAHGAAAQSIALGQPADESALSAQPELQAQQYAPAVVNNLLDEGTI